MSAVTVLPYGPEALLFEVDGPDDAGAMAGRVDSLAGEVRGVPGLVDVVPAARTVLVTGTRAGLDAARARALEWAPGGSRERTGALHEIAVRYDGPDLGAIARATGLDTAEVVRLHSGARYRVAFCGFSPGFGYLTGLPESLHVPRRADPRASVPARSVGVAGEYSAVYPRVSPGGWNLLGTALVDLWDTGAERPALLAPGDEVRFVERS